MTKIEETKDYSKFELHQFNRNIGNTDRLVSSMKKYGWIPAFPMYVIRNGRGKFKIKAGHHRFEAARQLDIPVKYIVWEDDISIHELEHTTSQWTLSDYLVSFVGCGRPDYLRVQDYIKRTGVDLASAISMLAGEQASSNNQGPRFKFGTYRVANDTSHAELVGRIITRLKEIKAEGADHRNFTRALSRVCFVREFDVNRFLKQAEQHKYLFDRQSTMAGYMQVIEEVYNRQRQAHHKLPLAFMADEQAAKRNAVQKHRK